MKNNLLTKIFVLLIIILFLETTYGQPNKIYIIFRIDDYGLDESNIYDELFRIFQNNKIPLVVGVVPFHFDVNADSVVKMDSSKVDFLKKYQLDNNIEIAQHGYAHLNNYNKKFSSEFYNVAYTSQLNKIEMGKLFLENAFNINIFTFIPPWNSYDSNTVKILAKLGFKNLSAATYGKINDINTNVNYIPYTVLLSELSNIKLTINEISKQNEGKTFLIVILMHSYDFKNSGIESSTQDYLTTNEIGQISLSELDQSLSGIKNTNNVNIVTFREISNLIKDLSNARLVSNTYFEDIVPVFWLNGFRNIYYLDQNEVNLNKYIRLIYQVIFYPTLFTVFISLFYLLLKKLKSKIIRHLKNISLFLLLLSSLMILIIVFFQLITPKYLVLITIMISLTIATTLIQRIGYHP